MLPASAKQKGRRFQQAVRDYLLDAFNEILQADDIRSTSMGAAGDDLLLSPLAKMMLPCSFEMKNVEEPSVGATLRQAHARCGENNTIPVCVFGRNKVKLPNALTIVPYIFFCRLFNGGQFQYDFMQHKLFPVINNFDYNPPCDLAWDSECVDVSGTTWYLREHRPNSCNLWLQWEDVKKKNDVAAILIFSRMEDIGPHVILPFGHFVRLIKLLWVQSDARKHLMRE